MNDILNRMRHEGASADWRTHARLGLVTSYDPKRHAAKVTIQPSGTETGWLPVWSLRAGNQWGIFAPPTPGDQVLVLFQEGDLDAGVILGGIFSDEDPPLNVPAGEMWIVHANGQYLKATNDGKLALHGAVQISLGNLTGTVRKFVLDTFMSLFNSHTHPIPSGNSSPPNQMMDASHLTSIVKGN